MKKLALALAAFGALAAGAAQADTTVIVHRDGPGHRPMGMHRMHRPMCNTVVKVVREHGHVRRVEKRVCR